MRPGKIREIGLNPAFEYGPAPTHGITPSGRSKQASNDRRAGGHDRRRSFLGDRIRGRHGRRPRRVYRNVLRSILRMGPARYFFHTLRISGNSRRGPTGGDSGRWRPSSDRAKMLEDTTRGSRPGVWLAHQERGSAPPGR